MPHVVIPVTNIEHEGALATRGSNSLPLVFGALGKLKSLTANVSVIFRSTYFWNNQMARYQGSCQARSTCAMPCHKRSAALKRQPHGKQLCPIRQRVKFWGNPNWLSRSPSSRPNIKTVHMN